MVYLVETAKRVLGFLVLGALISACATPQRQYQIGRQ
jgi:hypothetical protein